MALRSRRRAVEPARATDRRKKCGQDMRRHTPFVTSSIRQGLASPSSNAPVVNEAISFREFRAPPRDRRQVAGHSARSLGHRASCRANRVKQFLRLPETNSMFNARELEVGAAAMSPRSTRQDTDRRQSPLSCSGTRARAPLFAIKNIATPHRPPENPSSRCPGWSKHVAAATATTMPKQLLCVLTASTFARRLLRRLTATRPGAE